MLCGIGSFCVLLIQIRPVHQGNRHVIGLATAIDAQGDLIACLVLVLHAVKFIHRGDSLVEAVFRSLSRYDSNPEQAKGWIEQSHHVENWRVWK